MVKKRIVACIAIVVAICLCLAGCSSTLEEKTSQAPSTAVSAAAPAESTAASAGTEGQKTIGVVQINFTNPYYIGASESFNEAAKNMGYEVIIQSAENSIEKEISLIENFIESKVDMIIADPQDAAALVDVFTRAANAGIPIIALRSPVDTGGKNYNCLINHYEGFKGVSYAVAESLNGTGEVLLMQGQIGHEASDSRQKGFDEAMANYPNIKLLDKQPCDWDPTKAVSVVENWLTAYNKIDCILSMTDGATPAIVNAVQDANRLSEIKIAGNDGEMECLEDMVAGKIMAEALLSSYRDAYNCMAYADAILKGYKVPQTVYLPIVLVCSSDIQTKIKANVKDTFLMATPEEAINISKDYVKEFTGYYDQYK